jgi:hypothetical protein
LTSVFKYLIHFSATPNGAYEPYTRSLNLKSETQIIQVPYKNVTLKSFHCHILFNGCKTEVTKTFFKKHLQDGMGLSFKVHLNESFETTLHLLKTKILPLDFTDLAREYQFQQHDFLLRSQYDENCAMLMLMIDTYGSR